jgi:hypothetical protein
MAGLRRVIHHRGTEDTEKTKHRDEEEKSVPESNPCLPHFILGFCLLCVLCASVVNTSSVLPAVGGR